MLQLARAAAVQTRSADQQNLQFRLIPSLFFSDRCLHAASADLQKWLFRLGVVHILAIGPSAQRLLICKSCDSVKYCRLFQQPRLASRPDQGHLGSSAGLPASMCSYLLNSSRQHQKLRFCLRVQHFFDGGSPGPGAQTADVLKQ